MAGTFNQSLQCTQDVFVGFQAPSPPVILKVPSTTTAARSWVKATGSLAWVVKEQGCWGMSQSGEGPGSGGGRPPVCRSLPDLSAARFGSDGGDNVVSGAVSKAYGGAFEGGLVTVGTGSTSM